MPHDKLPSTFETTEGTTGNIVNEETQKLKIYYYNFNYYIFFNNPFFG
jgi:hypothetical protein